MDNRARRALLLFLLLALAACARETPVPPTPTSPQTEVSPTAAETLKPEIIPTETPIPSKTPSLLNGEGGFLIPREEPVQIWNEIPIMPDAILGEETGGAYHFVITATPLEVVEYYSVGLSNNWEYMGIGETANGKIMIFQQPERVLTISALVVDGEDFIHVILLLE
jgi:hypothetical protein